MSEEITFPQTADGVADLVNEQFPERSADADWTDRQVWIKAGERNVARFLNRLRKQREDDLLETPT